MEGVLFDRMVDLCDFRTVFIRLDGGNASLQMIVKQSEAGVGHASTTCPPLIKR